MNCFSRYVSFLLCFYLSIGYAQDKKYDISTPIDIPATGVNKVLCMKNGNTMLFHFEPAKKIKVIVFDSLHKQIARTEEPCRILDILSLEHVVFKGMYDINNEAVLFFDQDHMSKHSLVRLRYNARTGMLTEEKLVAESKSEDKRMHFFVMKNKDDDNYSILFATDKHHPKESDIFVVFFDNKHKSIREVQIPVDRKKYDDLEVVNAESQPNGVMVSLSLGIIKENAIPGNSNLGIPPTPTVYDYHLAMYYVPKDSSNAILASAHLSAQTYPFYANYTYNSYAKTMNLLLLGYRELLYKYGLEWLPAAEIQHLLFKIDESNMAVDFKWIKNKSANDFLKQKTDSSAFFEGLPINMYTNENGLSTIISESYSRYVEPETRVRTNHYSYFGRVGITQYDDDGNEIWGAVLPVSQRYTSYREYYSAYEFSKKWQSQTLFGDLPEAVYERQFVSVNSYTYNKNFYLIFNDNNKNFNNSLEHPGDTVYNFNNTNTCYYKIDRKKEITKHYLYGEPAVGEYKSTFIESADFDEKREVYAALVQCRKGDNVSLCMAWSHLE